MRDRRQPSHPSCLWRVIVELKRLDDPYFRGLVSDSPRIDCNRHGFLLVMISLRVRAMNGRSQWTRLRPHVGSLQPFLTACPEAADGTGKFTLTCAPGATSTRFVWVTSRPFSLQRARMS